MPNSINSTGSSDNSLPTSNDCGSRTYAAPWIERTTIDATPNAGVVAEWSEAAIDRKCIAKPIDASDPQSGICNSASVAGIKPVFIQPVTRNPKRRADVTEYPIDSETLLFDDTFQTVFHLNRTAYHVWCHCDGRSLEQLSASLTKALDVEFDAALKNIKELIRQFASLGLLKDEITDAATV